MQFCNYKKSLKAFASVVALTTGLLGAHEKALANDAAKNYPDRPVRIIVPVSAGGSTDIITRIVAQKLGEIWKQTVIVENLTGGGGAIGAARAAKANPDGYTLVAHGDTILLNTITMKNPPYTMDDFVGANRFVVNPQVLVSNPKFAPKNIKEYIEYAKKTPNGISLAVPTNGGIGHITHVMLEKDAGISVTHVPYKGGAPAAIDTIAGHVDATIITLAAVAEYINQGSLVALAVSTPERSPQFPNVPTMAESGYPNTVVESWQGILAPKNTPKEIVDKLHRDIATVMSDPHVIKLAEAQGFMVSPMPSTEAFNQWLKKEHVKYGNIVKSSGMTVN